MHTFLYIFHTQFSFPAIFTTSLQFSHISHSSHFTQFIHFYHLGTVYTSQQQSISFIPSHTISHLFHTHSHPFTLIHTPRILNLFHIHQRFYLNSYYILFEKTQLIYPTLCLVQSIVNAIIFKNTEHIYC